MKKSLQKKWRYQADDEIIKREEKVEACGEEREEREGK